MVHDPDEALRRMCVRSMLFLLACGPSDRASQLPDIAVSMSREADPTSVVEITLSAISARGPSNEIGASDTYGEPPAVDCETITRCAYMRRFQSRLHCDPDTRLAAELLAVQFLVSVEGVVPVAVTHHRGHGCNDPLTRENRARLLMGPGLNEIIADIRLPEHGWGPLPRGAQHSVEWTLGDCSTICADYVIETTPNYCSRFFVTPP